MTIIPFLTSYYRVQKALQWWSYRQSSKFILEAENIRDSLLQETFTMRRNLDLLSTNPWELSSEKIKQYLDKVDHLHHSLVDISDRLFPESLQDSFPLAIEGLLKSWLVTNPHLYFQIDMPIYWRHEPPQSGLIILNSLEELLTITISDILMPNSIYISLKQKQGLGQLSVKINYSEVCNILFHSSLSSLDYLCQSCQFLTSAKCFYYTQSSRVYWYFYW
ncbi:hypothetical protein [Nostoc parmelioides]|uniref:Uncharacterized protein n=1 Tax=Nostoc parmelioides FACHB-3921 TaxID=2692909 RepID=A0ABR8BDB4_9NOSO|nr:hypothetical protein [Nostoc parmelioides]MBD2252087.1 hypothetical protein [Nostoc parmelioides FACHB-3921]